MASGPDTREDEGSYYPGGKVVPKGPTGKAGLTLDDTVTEASDHGVKSSGIWTFVKGLFGGLAKVATSGSYNDLADKPTIPAEVTETTVSNWGFLKKAWSDLTSYFVAKVTGYGLSDASNVSITKGDAADTISVTPQGGTAVTTSVPRLNALYGRALEWKNDTSRNECRVFYVGDFSVDDFSGISTVAKYWIVDRLSSYGFVHPDSVVYDESTYCFTITYTFALYYKETVQLYIGDCYISSCAIAGTITGDLESELLGLTDGEPTNSHVAILFSQQATSPAERTTQLLNNAELEASINVVCDAMGGGIKYDTTSKRYYFEV